MIEPSFRRASALGTMVPRRHADGLTTPERRRWPLQYSADNTAGDRAETFGLGRIIYKGRQWAVTSDGLERCDGGTYFIRTEALDPPGDGYSWPDHLAAKAWCDWPDFVAAYAVAVLVHRLDAGRVRIPSLK